jgi:teichuronic acid biosynthesis glycosyltransferase TuaG
MEALVSIITPTYNSAKYIAETIFSVQNQTYQNWEIIIIDDDSTDETAPIILELAKKDKRIQFYKLNENSGTGIARNYALKYAKGKYIAFLDSDDLWKPEKLQKQIRFLKQNKVAFTFSFFECIDEKGMALNKRMESPKKLSLLRLFFCNYIGNLTAIYDSEELGKIPIATIRKRQDWILWITILKKIKVAYPLEESLAFYRIRNNSVSSNKIKLLKENYNVYYKYYKYNALVSALFLMIFIFNHLFVKSFYTKKIR